MARPKGKLFALLAVFAAIGLVTATGAFSSVTASRTVSVDTAGDDTALLGFSVDNSNLASVGSDGELTLTFDSVNVDADTDFGAVFTITNNGNDDISSLYIADEDTEAPSGFSTLNDDSLEFKVSGSSIEGSGNSVSLTSGSSVTVSISISIGDSATPTTNFLNGNIVIVAN